MAEKPRIGRIYDVKPSRDGKMTSGALRPRAESGSWKRTKINYEAPAELGLRVDDIVEFESGRVINKAKNIRVMKVTKKVGSLR
ncbi:hypothetical protein KY325_00445 [Candidatus Woesearchaeota archaeon]|nr:hypothetical protein [Candidatus Woesearchaeota archaeon]MBW3017614.1 hypothetical protein [Candidatus Woesearchaeota archaeon]